MSWSGNDPNDPHRYDDILSLPRHVSETHPRMSRHDRAAQFAPFAALTGLGAAIHETARRTEERVTLDDSAKAELDLRLRELRRRAGGQPEISVTYFRPDEKKDGGAYVTLTGRLRKIDAYERLLTFADGTKIPLDDILSVDDME